MIGLPANTRVWIVGHTDMRKGFDELAALVQTTLAANPFCGHVFVFRGRRGDIIKVLWFNGQGLMLLAKRLERGRFVWSQAASGSIALTPEAHRLATHAASAEAKTGSVRPLGSSRRDFPAHRICATCEQLRTRLPERQACRLMVDLLDLADRAAVVGELAVALAVLNDQGELPDIDALRARFAPRAAVMPTVPSSRRGMNALAHAYSLSAGNRLFSL